MARETCGSSTRLSAALVAAILIPGCFLAYFSLQNIRSQRELAEKRLLEEEQALAANLGTVAREELVEAATGFFAAFDQRRQDARKAALATGAGRHVRRWFELDGGGHFLWPRYAAAHAPGGLAAESARFTALFSAAERAELRRHDPDAAAGLYRQAAAAARHDAGRAAAVNGLARALARSGRIEQAVSQYKLLMERHGTTRDEEGVAYARYALHQLTRVSAPDQASVASVVSSLLSRLESGDDPLTDQTEPLLGEVEAWLALNPVVEEASGRIPRGIAVLRSRLAFVDRDAKVVEFFQSDDPASFPMLDLGPFAAVAGEVAGSPRLYVVRRPAKGSGVTGFEVALEQLRTALLERGAGAATRLEMEVEIVPAGGEREAAAGPAAVSRDLGPLLPGWQVIVRPRDPAVVSRCVSRQRWIYGTTLVLLAGGWATADRRQGGQDLREQGDGVVP